MRCRDRLNRIVLFLIFVKAFKLVIDLTLGLLRLDLVSVVPSLGSKHHLQPNLMIYFGWVHVVADICDHLAIDISTVD